MTKPIQHDSETGTPEAHCPLLESGGRGQELLGSLVQELSKERLEQIQRTTRDLQETLQGGPNFKGVIHALKDAARQLENHARTIGDHDEMLRGNGGKVGLRAQVDQHAIAISAIQSDIRWAKRYLMGLGFGGIVGGGSVLGVLLAILDKLGSG